MNQLLLKTSPVLGAVALLFAGCGGGGQAPGVGTEAGGDFLVLETVPQNNGRLFLNESVRIDFSNTVDLNSADLNTVSFAVLDQNGQPTTEQPVGTFRLSTRPGDEDPGRRLEFVPTFPTNDTYDNGGFRPARTYLMQLVGGNQRNNTVLRDLNGKGLTIPTTLSFSTAEGTVPSELFRDVAPGGPARVAFTVTPPLAAGESTLNQLGQADVEIRLEFNQPINPASNNVPVALDTDPLLRNQVQRGRLFMEYDDPDLGQNAWIPADVEIEVNDLTRSVVVLRPVGVLPNNAEIRVIVENTLEDISGESNVSNAAYDRVFASFRTDSSYDPQFDAVVDEFDTRDTIDFGAPFLEPVGQMGVGEISSSFEFEGQQTILDYSPTNREVILNTDFTQIQPSNGQPFNVSGGVFNFRNVNIPPGVIVQGTGTNPMVWLVSGDFTVSGTLSVRGGNGDRVNTLNSANFPAAGGIGQCGGGNGGRGSPNSLTRSPQGEDGFGPGQIPGGGGSAGTLACIASCPRGSAGGGGSFASAGDPWYKTLSFPQVTGVGGQSPCSPGGAPGPLGFEPTRLDDDFWGIAVDVNRQMRIVGELEDLRGGAGGGGGGDHSTNCTINDPAYIGDDKGGGGGGGGGVIVVKCLGTITVNEDGIITADGGDGGGGEQAGASDQGGGGGAGSGGMVVLIAGETIDLHVNGGTYANTSAAGAYDFCLSADGGVCLTGTFQGRPSLGVPNITGKYLNRSQGPVIASTYNNSPLGGFGGFGVIQLMAPVDDGNTDGTNTVLDDGIRIFIAGVQQNGTRKEEYLAWRGIPDENGVFRDDSNNQLNIGNGDGDMRPSPQLLPTTVSSQTRMRSKWLDTGATVRRAVAGPDGLPRGVTDPTSSIVGPDYSFVGTTFSPGAINHGYVDYTAPQGADRVTVAQPAILNETAVISSLEANSTFLGRPAYRVTLATGALGTESNRYVHYQAELYNQLGTLLGEYRILSHSDRVLTLATDATLPSDASRLQVRAKFFNVRVDGDEGLGQTYQGASLRPVPQANARIGFAFHRDPANALSSGNDPNRYPNLVGSFTYDLTDPAVQETVRQGSYSFVRWDVLFDVAFRAEVGDVPAALSPESPTISLDYLRLPLRY